MEFQHFAHWPLCFLFLLLSFHICSATDVDVLEGWIRNARGLGLGATETNAMGVMKEILESNSADSKRILGMRPGDGGGVRGADGAVLRRLNTVDAGLNSAGVRTLGEELAEIGLRAKKKLWIDGYDKETEDAEEDQDNAKRKVKLVLTKLEEHKESELFERIKPADNRQLREMDDTYSSKRYKDIMTDLSRKSVAELPGLSQALKDAAEYVNVAYSNLAIGITGASDVPESVKKAIGVMKDVKDNSRDDLKVLGMPINAIDFNAIDEAYRQRVEAMNLTDENVKSLKGLVASLRSVTLRRLNMAYEELAKGMPQYRTVQDTINAMRAVERTVYDLDTFGLRGEPENAVAFDAEYHRRAEAIGRRNGNARRHFGLRWRTEEAIRKLNEDFDSVLRRKSTLLTGEPRALWEKLAEMEGKAELNLFGNPRDIEGLDAEFMRRSKDIDAEGLREYRGLKLRAEWAKERLSKAYFLVADKLGFSASSATNSEVQSALRKGKEILTRTKWEEMLGSPELKEREIQEAYRRQLEGLNREKGEVKKLPGLAKALETVANELALARQVMVDRVRPPAPHTGPAGTPEEEASWRLAELTKEFDNQPPKEISESCRDEAPNCRENAFLCKNEFYVSLMHSKCRRTCKVCMQSGEAAHCEDRNTQDCQSWGPSFCTSSAYSKGMKMQHCAKYCGLCPPVSVQS